MLFETHGFEFGISARLRAVWFSHFLIGSGN